MRNDVPARFSVDACVTQAAGTAGREASAAIATNPSRSATVGADKDCDARASSPPHGVSVSRRTSPR
jgi:hypothetical protein